MVLSVAGGSYVLISRITSILAFKKSIPIRRFIDELEKVRKVIDASHGRAVKSIVTLDDGSIVLSAVDSETLRKRLEK